MAREGRAGRAEISAHAERARRGSGTLPGWAWVVFALAVAFKLLLVSHEEVLPHGSDSGEYIRAAAQWYWGQDYGKTTHVRQPVFPLFLAAVSALGMPARLAFEFTWAAAAGVMIIGLRRCGVSAALSLAAGTLMEVHPWPVFVFSRVLQDALYAPLFVAFACAVGAAAVARTRRTLVAWGLFASGACALAANTRPESVVLWPVLAAAAGGVLLLHRWGREDRSLTIARLVAASVAPFLAAQALTQAVKCANLRAIGVYETCDISTPGFRALYDALLAIPPRFQDSRAPIPRDVREKAYRVSPTFALLAPVMENPSANRSARLDPGVRTDKSPDWGSDNFWAIREAAWCYKDDWCSARELDGFYTKAAGEIRAAMDRGELVHRPVLLSYIPPDWDSLLYKELPESFQRCVLRLIRTHLRHPPLDSGADGDDGSCREVFDAVAVRRIIPGRVRAGGQSDATWWYGEGGIALTRGWLETLEAVYGVLGKVGVGAAVGALALLPMGLRRGWVRPELAVAAGVVWSGVIGRIVIATMLDATGISAQPRYLLGAAGLWMALLAFHGEIVVSAARGLAASLIAARRSRLRRSESRGPAGVPVADPLTFSGQAVEGRGYAASHAA